MATKKVPGLVTQVEDDHAYDFTVSETGKTETLVLMHSRMGIRIELSLDRSALSLWISPQAGKELDCRYRNFSCRDDHTSIFDAVSFPELRQRRFLGCDYDPFHSVLRFAGQSIHVLSLLDQPCVVLWAEAEEVIDVKADKQDTSLERSPRLFAVRHPDRGLVLDFAAALGRGRGVFRHQPETSKGRSTHARIVLAPNQTLVIGGELAKENVSRMAARTASRAPLALLRDNEKKLARALEPGTAVFKARPEMQRLYDTNKRHLLSVQDASGAVRAALKYVYYLIWSTDGTVTSAAMAQTGDQGFLRRWTEFILANPTSQETPPKGRFYGQLVSPAITKREEFGSLCALLPAFMHRNLTGDARFVCGKYLELLEEVVDWLDRYCWDREVGALGCYYIAGGSEDPFYGSVDFGVDAAVGCFLPRNLHAPRYDGKLLLRAYEFNMNLNHYNMRLLLSSATAGKRAEYHLQKAREVERFLTHLLDRNLEAYYLLEGGRLEPIAKGPETRHGLFAIQSRLPALYAPRFAELFMARMQSFEAETAASVKGKMPCYYYGILSGLDTEFVDEGAILASLDVSLPYHTKASRYLPMAYTMVETMGAREGTYNDIRPQAFSAGPFQAAIANLAVRVMPEGIAVRATSALSAFRGFEYLKGKLDIEYSGKGTIRRVVMNGKELAGSLQIPDDRVRSGKNRVLVELGRGKPTGACLVYSTMRLHSVGAQKAPRVYELSGLCQNVLAFRDLGEEVEVLDGEGRVVAFTRKDFGRHSFIEIGDRGKFTVRV
jgi:hypothetical protein